MPKRLDELAEDREPWEQQPGETRSQFTRFQIFLEAGAIRRVITTADVIGVPRNSLHILSSLMRWRERAELYDQEQTRARRARQAVDAEKLHDVEAATAGRMMEQINRGIDALADREEALAPEQIPRWVETASKLGRLAFGEPSELVSLTSPRDAPVRVAQVDAAIDEMTPEQRRRYALDLADEVRRRAAGAREADPSSA